MCPRLGISPGVARSRHLVFLWRDSRLAAAVGLHLALYDVDDLRGALRADPRGRYARANLQSVEALLDAPSAPASVVLPGAEPLEPGPLN